MRLESLQGPAQRSDPCVIVQLDGGDNHHSAAQTRRDHANDLRLRSHGWTVLRYTWVLVHEHPEAVKADILMALGIA